MNMASLAHRCNAHKLCAKAAPAAPRLSVARTKCKVASGQFSSQQASDVSRIFEQHKLLMASGFTYDQASLILHIGQKQAMPSKLATGTGGQVGIDPVATPAATDIDSNSTLTEQQQQQQQLSLKALEERLSFLELEVLKQSIAEPVPGPLAAATPMQQQQQRAVPSGSNMASNAVTHTSWPDEPALPQGLGICNPELLDPEVLAIAQALLIRRGYTGPEQWAGAEQGFTVVGGSAVGATGSEDSGMLRNRNARQGTRTPNSIWSRKRAQQQLRAKPWRYADDEPYHPSSMLPYGYQPNSAMLRGSRSSADGGLVDPDLGDDLAPYEPNGLAVAGTFLVVYAGVLLTFFAVVCGTAESSAIDPVELSMFWW